MSETLEARFAPLATYNGERARGIMHTPEWVAKMDILQREWDLWQELQEQQRVAERSRKWLKGESDA